jgi:hypothetical protein
MFWLSLVLTNIVRKYISIILIFRHLLRIAFFFNPVHDLIWEIFYNIEKTVFYLPPHIESVITKREIFKSPTISLYFKDGVYIAQAHLQLLGWSNLSTSVFWGAKTTGTQHHGKLCVDFYDYFCINIKASISVNFNIFLLSLLL